MPGHLTHQRLEPKAPSGEDLSRLLYDACPDAVIVIGDDLKILFANPAIEDVFGYTPQDVVGREFAMLQPEHVRAAYSEALQRLFVSGETIPARRDARGLGLHRDGRAFPVAITYAWLGPHRYGGFIRDISAEVAAERTHEFRDRVMESSPNAIGAVDLQGRLTLVNGRFCEMTGYTQDELLGSSFDHLIAQHALPDMLTYFQRITAGESVDPFEFEALRKDGSTFIARASLRPLMDRGVIVGVIGITEDITEQKRAGEALARAQDFRDRVLEASTSAIAASDREGRFTLVNERLCEITGYRRDELLGKRLRPIVAPDSADHVRFAFDKVVAGGAVNDLEVDIVRKDGCAVTIRLTLRPLIEDGVVTGVVGLADDITERKRAERALIESEERYRQMFESKSAVRYLIDPATRCIVEPNEAACLYYGYSRDELTGMDMSRINTLLAPEITREMEAAFREGRTVLEFQHRLASGDVRDVELYTGRIDLRGKPYLMMNVFDVTERKRAVERLAEQSRLLEEKSELLELALAAERDRARRDTLTGAFNHAAIAGEVSRLISSPDTKSFALAMVDVDGLKAVNDTYGHPTGDAVLVAVAGTLSNRNALVGRYGGDEFIAILPGADRDAAVTYRDEVVQSLANIELRDPDTGSRIQIVASIGLSIYPEEADAVEDLIKLSDSAMYAARRQRADVTASTSFARIHGGDRAAELVGEIVPFLTSPGDLKQKLNLVAERLSAGAGYEGVNFSLYPESGTTARSASFSEDSRDAAEEYDEESLPPDEAGPMRKLLQTTRRPIIIDDVSTSEFTTPAQREILASVGIQSGLVAPMVWRGELLGSVAVGSKRLAAFGPRDAQFLSAIATQVTAIVRTAALVDDLQSASDRLLQAHTETVMMLAAAAEAHDDSTGRHLRRVRTIAQALAAELGHDEGSAKEIGLAAVLHDIGKIRVPDYVLGSTASLSDAEWALMKDHTIWGGEFLLARGGFELAAQVARSHHERWDGTGYPDGLLEEQIPEAAAITAVADSLDAITNDRPYRAGRALADAILEIQTWSGRQFNPAIVDALVRLYERDALPYGDEQDRVAQLAA